MAYEFLSILLVEDGRHLNENSQDHLNNYFKEGWEYVDSILPIVSTGSDYQKRGAVMIIIKKAKNVLPE